MNSSVMGFDGVEARKVRQEKSHANGGIITASMGIKKGTVD